MKKISVLGTGCSKCKTLQTNAEQAAEALDVPYEIEKVEDITKIVEYGVMSTPALAVDGKVVASGKVLSAAEIEKLL